PPTVLGEVDAPDEADRDADQRSDQEDLATADDGIRHPAAGLADRRRQVGEEVEREGRDAVHGDVPEEEEEDADGQCRRSPCQREHDPFDEAAAPVASRGDRHAVAAPGRVTRPMRRRAIAFTTTVIANSTRPTSTSAERYTSSVASVNSLASTAAMV